MKSPSRFILEAEILQPADSNILESYPVYGLNTHPDGRPYYAFDEINWGRTLLKDDYRPMFHSDLRRFKKDSGRRSLEIRKLLRRFIDVCNAHRYHRPLARRFACPWRLEARQHHRSGQLLARPWSSLGAGQGSIGPGKIPMTAKPRDEERWMPKFRQWKRGCRCREVRTSGHLATHEPRTGSWRPEPPGAMRSDIYSLGGTLSTCLLTGRPLHSDGDETLPGVLRKVQWGFAAIQSRLASSILRDLTREALEAGLASKAMTFATTRAATRRDGPLADEHRA